MVKYKKVFKEMLEYNQQLFNEFKDVHDRFEKDQDKWRDALNDKGTKVLRVVRRYENELCSKSENTGFGKFSMTLSDKFWEEVRGHLPSIDKVKIV